jgi:hypothetical protein
MAEPFRFSDGQLAYSVEDLVKLCKRSPSESINYLMRADFEKWLAYIGKTDLAQITQTIRQEQLSDSEKLEQFLAKCKLAVTGKSQTITSNQPVQSNNFMNNLSQFFQNLIPKKSTK